MENLNESKGDRVYETSDVYSVPYEMAKSIYIDMLTDEGLPLKQRVSKAVAERLTLDIGGVEIEPFNNNNAVYIKLEIKGCKQDIAEVDRALEARYGDDDE